MLGAGSFGQVYTGYQRSLDRKVAVKVLDPGIAVDQEKRRAFIAEAQQCARLNHPNLVQVYDICSENGYHFIVMELLAGGNMGDYLKRHGPPTVKMQHVSFTRLSRPLAMPRLSVWCTVMSNRTTF